MNLKTKFLLKKITSILCLVVAIALFFTGWISVRTNDYTKQLKKELRELDNELEELEEECEEMQEQMEDMADEMDIELTFSVEDSYESAKMLYVTYIFILFKCTVIRINHWIFLGQALIYQCIITFKKN